ncbi:MAG TPA: nuclear transport factor 2 family protein [Stellaceae bacterium]|nr:nuclear transport factor 2 family protein [Stellaceae bacterium]
MTSSDIDAVLSANLEFYRAFAGRDAAAMDAIWAREAPVTCVHPGWTPLSGRAGVLKSWRDILANPESPRVMCHDDQAFLHGEVALVLCEEELDAGHLIATNIFVREAGAWRMVHHQASPIIVRSLEADARTRRRGPRR